MTAESRNSGTNKTLIPKQWRGKRVAAVTNKHATIEQLLEAMVSVRSVPRLYTDDYPEKLACQGPEVDSR
jgi:hypothetical protein